MEASKGETGGQKPMVAPTVDPGTKSASDGSQGTNESGDGSASKAKAAAVAAGAGAAVASVAGGIAVAARDTRRRVLGIPIGRRSRVQRVVAGAAGSAVEKVREPAKRVGSRFSRNP